MWNAATPQQSTRLHDDPDVNVSPSDINDAGVVVGGFGLPAQSRAFVWTADGGLVDYGLQDPDMEFQQARWLAVNASGKLVGFWNVHSSTVHATGGQAGTPTVLSLGSMSETYPSIATAVNDAGTVVGLGLAADTPALVPVVFDGDGAFTEIPGATLDQENGCASTSNAAGVIVGSAGIGSASGCVPGLVCGSTATASCTIYDVVDDPGPFVPAERHRDQCERRHRRLRSRRGRQPGRFRADADPVGRDLRRRLRQPVAVTRLRRPARIMHGGSRGGSRSRRSAASAPSAPTGRSGNRRRARR